MANHLSQHAKECEYIYVVCVCKEVSTMSLDTLSFFYCFNRKS